VDDEEPGTRHPQRATDARADVEVSAVTVVGPVTVPASALEPAVTRTTEHRPAADGRPPLELVRSARRRRSANAFARDGRVVVQLPAGMPAEAEQRLIASLVDRVTGRARARQVAGDDQLMARARELADRYVDGVRPTAVTWSSRMQRRYGSCTPATGTIRISQRLAAYPSYVLDYLLVHELAHLIERGHGPRFTAIEERFPQTERARGFLEGIEHAAAGPATRDDADVDDTAIVD
jgi:hypothetical protein